MKSVLIIHLGNETRSETVTFLGKRVKIEFRGCQGDTEKARSIIRENDGQVDAIGLEGLPSHLELGRVKKPHKTGIALLQAAQKTPVVDGSEIRSGLERWGVILADRAQPGIFSQKRILMVPGLNHRGLADALRKRAAAIRYADPLIFFGLPNFPGIGSGSTLEQAAQPTLEHLQDVPFTRIKPQPEKPVHARIREPFKWADVLAGDIRSIRCCAPDKLNGKIVVAEWATEEDIEDLHRRGVSVVITIMPSLEDSQNLGMWPASVIEAVLVALRPMENSPLSEDTYLDLLADIDWSPEIRFLNPEEQEVNKFAFLIHPLNVEFIHKHPAFRWTKILPDNLVETVAAYLSPMYISKITGAVSPTTGQRVEGYIFSLGATPRQMLKHSDRFTYDRIEEAARMAERRGARIMGLGAFTSVVGDAGITVAHESDIAITSGNSLTVSATLEAAKQAVIKMGATDLTKGKVMIVGATGSIGSVCSRLLAQAIGDVVLVSIEPERLIDLKRTIKNETPGARVVIATHPDSFLGECELVVSTTSAFGQRVIDISKCKPGAVICDVARPPDVNEPEAALRPDVLVIESGEVIIPGDVDFGYDIGLPPKVAYACLAETALLAMEGRFEDYTLGRDITIERVKEIYHLFKKHQFKIAELRSFNKPVTEEVLAEKRALAEKYRKNPELFEQVKAEAAAKLAKIPIAAKGVKRSKGITRKYVSQFFSKFGDFVFWISGERKKGVAKEKEAAVVE
ncbi:MAG: serine carboxypeptidase [Calditrichia bacterium]